MKSKDNNARQHLTHLPRYHDPAYEAHLEQIGDDLVAHAQLQGEQNGAHNKPTSFGEFSAYILNKVRATVQEAIDFNHATHQPVSGAVVAHSVDQESRARVAKLERSMDDDRHELLRIRREAETVKPDIARARTCVFAYLCIAVFAISDGGLSYPAFRHLLLPVAAAASAAFGVAAVVGFGAHQLGGFIKRARARAAYWYRYAGVLAIYAIGFFKLSCLRANTYNDVVSIAVDTNNTVSAPAGHASSIGIALVSILLFWFSLFLSVRFYRRSEERLQRQAYQEKIGAARVVEERIRETKARIAAIEGETLVIKGEAAARYEYALAWESRLIATGNKAIEAYVDKNLRFRTDGVCPDFFNHPPKLSITTFFNRLKKNKNDEDNTSAPANG